jgi:type II secretory pathway pseudopilin PulG
MVKREYAMRACKQQSGISMIGILVLLALFSFFLLVLLRLMPSWMDGRSVRAAVESVAEASDASMPLREVNRKIDSVFNTNRIEVIRARDVKVYREKESIVIDASYEHRTPLFEGVDAVLIFDDIKVTVK